MRGLVSTEQNRGGESKGIVRRGGHKQRPCPQFEEPWRTMLGVVADDSR